MTKYNGERVLVVPRTVFEQVGAFNGLRRNPADYLSAFLQPGIARFADRDAVEDDPGFKQIIAYALFRHKGRYLTYARTNKSGESRLHKKLSLGIGGHINPKDGLTDNIHTYLTGMEREIREEITFVGSVRQQLFAVINDDTNDVGSVHLGIVHIFDAENDQVISNEKALEDLCFRDTEELTGPLYDRLETWSAICIDALTENHDKGAAL